MRLPAPLASSPWAKSRWLILAPHPDDETLGAGALIAEVAAAGRLAGVAFLTSGEGSHPQGVVGLAAARRAEAALALRRLTGRPAPVIWIGWPDAYPVASHDPRYAYDAARFGALLRRLRVQALAVTAADDPHCDHAAAYTFAHAAVRTTGRRIAVFEYPVWSAPGTRRGWRLRTRDIALGRRRHALAAHRSQLTPRFGPGFRLPPERRRMATFDVLHIRRGLWA